VVHFVVMTAEFGSQTMFTQSQLENQRLFNVGPMAMPEQAGDKAKRVTRKLMIFAGATTADLLESSGAEFLMEKIKGKKITPLQEKLDNMPTGTPEQISEKLKQEKKVVNVKSFFSAGAFVEDGISDELYVMGMNAMLRKLTGLEEVSYVTPTAKFISGWTNLLSFASGKFTKTKEFWKKPWNVINAVNVESGIGLLEEAPFGIGKMIAWGHDAFDEKLKKSEAVQLANGVALAAVTGYHIEKNMVNAPKE